MKKIKTTKKWLKDNFEIISADYGKLQKLLHFRTPEYYCTRAEGWACDAYIVTDEDVCPPKDYAILDGYSCIGETVNYDVLRKYDKAAGKTLCAFDEGGYSVEKEQKARTDMDDLIIAFCREASKS